jgi:hypothetical protein
MGRCEDGRGRAFFVRCETGDWLSCADNAIPKSVSAEVVLTSNTRYDTNFS